MALEIRWYNGTPYLTDDTTQIEAVWYNGAPMLEYYEYEAPAGGLSIPVAMHHYMNNLGR